MDDTDLFSASRLLGGSSGGGGSFLLSNEDTFFLSIIGRGGGDSASGVDDGDNDLYDATGETGGEGYPEDFLLVIDSTLSTSVSS